MDRGGVDHAEPHRLEIVVLVDLAPVHTSLQAFLEDKVKPYALLMYTSVPFIKR